MKILTTDDVKEFVANRKSGETEMEMYFKLFEMEKNGEIVIKKQDDLEAARNQAFMDFFADVLGMEPQPGTPVIILPEKQLFIFKEKYYYCLTANEAKEKVIAYMDIKLYQVNPEFVTDHSSFLGHDSGSEEILNALIDKGIYGIDGIKKLIDSYDQFIEDIIDSDGYTPYIGQKCRSMGTHLIDGHEFFIFEEQANSNELDPVTVENDNYYRSILEKWLHDNDNDFAVPYGLLRIKQDDYIAFQVETREFYFFNSAEERKEIRKEILESLYLVEYGMLIKHCSSLDNDAGSRQILSALKEHEESYQEGLLKLIDDLESLIDDLIEENGYEYYIGNEESHRHIVGNDLIMYESVCV